MKYTDFVKEQMKNPKLQGMKQTEKMSMIGKMWRASGHSKKSKGNGMIGDGMISDGFNKLGLSDKNLKKLVGKGMCPSTKGNGLVGDILGEMAEGFTKSKTLGSKIKGGIKF